MDSAGYDKSWALDVWQQLQKECPGERIDWWVGHDVTTGWAAVEGPSVAAYGKSALVMHMNYADYQAYKGSVGQRAAEKEREQRRLFAKANRCFANGPLLRDALKEFATEVSMLVPGFASIAVHPSSHRLHVVTFGRMDRESDRIKQGGLAVAGFASAIKHAWSNPGSPEKLKENPQMRVIGVREPGGGEERALKKLADDTADRKVNLIALPFDENRDELFEEIGRANISLMLSWHCVANLRDAQELATKLKRDLKYKLVCTWEQTARVFCDGLGLSWPEVHAKVPSTLSPAEAAHSATAPSNFATIPKLASPKEFAAKGIEMPDSMLLRAESRVVRFHHLRGPLRDAIIRWAIERDKPIKLRLQAGRGGAGKTRLLIEVCEKLENQNGWRAGFIDRSQSTTIGLPELLREGKPCLLVLDYAETRSSEIVELVRVAVHAKESPPLRLVLLARDGGDWWNHLADAAGKDDVIAAILQGFQTKAGPYRMEQERIQRKDRVAFFDDALNDFAAFRKKVAPAGAPDLSDDIFADPLFIHLAALACLRGDVAISDKDLLGIAIGHERSYWRQLLNNADLPEQFMRSIEQGMALLTLYGGKRSAKEAKAILERAPAMSQIEASDHARIFEVLRQLYDWDGGLRGLQPDILGEALVSEAFDRDDELLDSAFLEATTREDVRSALTVLTRLGRRVPDAQRWLRRVLQRRLRSLSEDAMYVGMETGAPMPDILAEVVKTAERHERHRTVDLLRSKFPKETFNLTNLDVEIRRQAVAFLEDKKTGKGAKRDIALAEALGSLSVALRKKGQLEEAARAAIESSRYASAAFRSDKEQDRRRFAPVLNNLGVCLSDVGQFDEALKAAEKAEGLWRSLAEKQPDAYTADWATSLSNLGSRLRDVGRFDDALKAVEKGEGLLRSLAEKQPDAYTADWARFLGNLGVHLSGAGRFEEALRTVEKAEVLERSLAVKQPEAYTEDWARSLGNLGNRLRDVGWFNEALEAAEKAEGLWRSLAEKQPDTYTADWTRSLHNLGSHLHDVGRFEDGLKAAEQAEGLWRALAEKQPDAYTADWATSLSNLGGHLSDAGRFDDALAVTEKGEGLQRSLAEKRPDAYTAVWARSLGNLGNALRDSGRFDDALEAAEKVEALWRSLAERQPDAYTADWARSLSNLSEAQLNFGRFASALGTAEKAVSRIASFVERYPIVYAPWLGFARRVIAGAYLRLERIDEAAAEARASADIWTDVATTRKNYESRQVAKSFLTLIQCEQALDQNDAVLSTFKRALDLLRIPLSVNPKPLEPTISAMMNLVRDIDPDALARILRDELHFSTKN
jgi:tetratricopeptide (TPR) repeat protein